MLLLWMTVRRERPVRDMAEVSADEVASQAAGKARRFRRIGVALEALPSDSAMLAEAIALARTHQAELVLIHVVEGPGGLWYGPQTGDAESRHDEDYLKNLAERLRGELASQGVPRIAAVLGYGSPPREIANLAKQNGIDLMVLGGHGHNSLAGPASRGDDFRCPAPSRYSRPGRAVAVDRAERNTFVSAYFRGAKGYHGQLLIRRSLAARGGCQRSSLSARMAGR